MLLPYHSIEAPCRSRLEIEKSLFIADAAPVSSPEEARIFWDGLRKEFRDATHHCFACRTGIGQAWEKSSDDGEPQGTAGHPMLGVLQKQDLTNVVIIVTRYFGGIKLGAGGLARAYSGAAAQVISAAHRLLFSPHVRCTVTFPYPMVGLMEKALAGTDLIVTDRQFTDTVGFTILFPSPSYEAEAARLRELTNGRMHLEEMGEEYVPLKE